MDISRAPDAKPLNSVADGGVVLAFFGRRSVVRGIKTSFAGEGGEVEPYLVTIGPFVEEHGERPTVYRPRDLESDLVVDDSSGCRFALSTAHQHLSLETVDSEDNPGIVLLDGTRLLMRVANFGRAGPKQVSYLDLQSGAFADPPSGDRALAVDHWQILGEDDDGAPAVLYAFPRE